MQYRTGRTWLIVTKPSGEVVKREVLAHFDHGSDTFGITFVGESQLRGYQFEILQGEIRRIRDRGEPAHALPGVE